jgi:hypothetical protein
MVGQEPEGRFLLPVEWHSSEDIVSRYATNMVVQHSDQEFIISFFEARPPLVLGKPEEIEAKLSQMKSVRADCVARIIVSTGRMPEFVKVLQDTLANYLAKFNDSE